MEGYLKKKSAGLFAGFKPVYAKIRGYYIIFQRTKEDKKDRTRFDLRHDVNIDTDPKDSLVIYVTQGSHQKKRAVLRTSDEREKAQWLQALNDAIIRADSETFSTHSGDSNPLTAAFKEDLYEAFSSKVFCDEWSIDNQVQAFNEVHGMFLKEIEQLEEMAKAKQDVTGKVSQVKNLAKTMGKLIKNVTDEVETSREEMHRILEGVAAIEYSKDPKKFLKKQYDKAERVREYEGKQSPAYLDLQEELKEGESTPSRSVTMEEVSNEGGSDNEEMFQDAHDEMIFGDEVKIIAKKPIIEGVPEIRLTLPAMRPPN